MATRDGVLGLLIGAAVGTLFLVPAHGSAQDSVSASCAAVFYPSPLEVLIRCAEQGFARTQYYLGVMYANGVEGVVLEDDAEAVRWYGLAAEQGNAGAQSALGWMYANGDGVPEDDAEAVRWYRLAVEQGLALAQSNLGGMYAHGDGVPEDDVEAVRWFRLAAAQGNASAQFNLGVMYRRGEGVPKDNAEAVRWYRLVAEQGDADAQLNLGVMYSRGEGVPEDLVFAYLWYNLSAAQGNEIAQSNKDVIERLMTREQIAEAHRLSREWMETHPQDGGNLGAKGGVRLTVGNQPSPDWRVSGQGAREAGRGVGRVKTDSRLTAQFEALEETVDDLRAEHNNERFQQWSVSALALVRRVFGESSLRLPAHSLMLSAV